MYVLDAQKSESLKGGPSFTLKNRAFRALWSISWAAFAVWTPPVFHPWRRFLLRLFGAKIARTARIYSSAFVWYPPNLKMGEYSVLGWRSLCYNMDKITIDDFGNVSQYVFLLAGTHDVNDQNFQLVTRPIYVGKHAWIGARATIGPGVSIGDYAVLGAASVAFRDLEPGWIYVGNPARKTRPRSRFAKMPSGEPSK